RSSASRRPGPGTVTPRAWAWRSAWPRTGRPGPARSWRTAARCGGRAAWRRYRAPPRGRTYPRRPPPARTGTPTLRGSVASIRIVHDPVQGHELDGDDSAHTLSPSLVLVLQTSGNPHRGQASDTDFEGLAWVWVRAVR